MDGDGSDVAAGVGDSLNGETKPDPAKLAQSAIIKQVSGNIFIPACQLGLAHVDVLLYVPTRLGYSHTLINANVLIDDSWSDA